MRDMQYYDKYFVLQNCSKYHKYIKGLELLTG